MYKIKDMIFDMLYFFIYEIKKKRQFAIGIIVGYIIGAML